MKRKHVAPLCPYCLGHHRIEDCLSPDAPVSSARLETPSHNGEYRGTIPVRVIPRAATGIVERTKPIKWGNHRSANEVAHRRAMARPACLKGHLYTPETSYTTKDGTRRCRICQRMHYLAWKARQAER